MNQQQYTTLVEVLKHLPDPRKRKRRRHRFLTLLCLIVAAVASTLRTPPAIARWVHSQREELFAVLPPAVAHLPSDATLRRALAAGCRRLGAGLDSVPATHKPICASS